jgi:quercetin dioxygenase-like cupin family protein
VRVRNVFVAKRLPNYDSHSQNSGGTEVSETETYRGKALDVKALIDYSTDSVVSKTLIDTAAGTITLFSFDAGQGLSEHTAPYDAVVHIVDGEAEITIGGNAVHAREGTMVVMPANVPHALQAAKRFKMLLTMIRASQTSG